DPDARAGAGGGGSAGASMRRPGTAVAAQDDARARQPEDDAGRLAGGAGRILGGTGGALELLVELGFRVADPAAERIEEPGLERRWLLRGALRRRWSGLRRGGPRRRGRGGRVGGPGETHPGEEQTPRKT